MLCLTEHLCLLKILIFYSGNDFYKENVHIYDIDTDTVQKKSGYIMKFL